MGGGVVGSWGIMDLAKRFVVQTLDQIRIPNFPGSGKGWGRWSAETQP